MIARNLVCILLLLPGTSISADKSKDRFGLANQVQVYLVHQTARQSFRVDAAGYRFARLGVGGVVGSAAILAQQNDSARTQQRLDLEDPVHYGKDRLAETLRRELGLGNLTVVREPSDLPILASDVADAAEPPPARGAPGYSARQAPVIVASVDTFQRRNPSGVVVEMVTGYWGMDNWKAKYFADFRVINLADSRVLLKTRCSWVTVEMLDIKKLEAADPKFDALNSAHMEEKIFANDGALLKAGLRSAAEQCVDKVKARLL